MTSVTAERASKLPTTSFQLVPRGTYFVLDDMYAEDVFFKVNKTLVVVVYSSFKDRVGIEITSFKDDSPVTVIKKLDIKYSL